MSIRFYKIRFILHEYLFLKINHYVASYFMSAKRKNSARVAVINPVNKQPRRLPPVAVSYQPPEGRYTIVNTDLAIERRHSKRYQARPQGEMLRGDEYRISLSTTAMVEHMVPTKSRVYVRQSRTALDTRLFRQGYKRMKILSRAVSSLVTAGMMLSAINYEVSIYHDNQNNTTGNVLRLLILLSTTVLIVLRIWYCREQLTILHREATKAYDQIFRSTIKDLVATILCFFMVPVFGTDITFQFECDVDDRECTFRLNQILTAMCLSLRLLYLIRVAFNSVADNSRRMRVFSKFAKVDVSPWFQIRRLLYEKHVALILPLQISYFVFISYLHMIWERELLFEERCHEQYFFSCGFSRMLWLHIVTAFSVGYGDIVPLTKLGKTFCAISMCMGVAGGSVLVAVATHGLQLARKELMLAHTLKEYDIFDGLCIRAAIIIQRTYRYHLKSRGKQCRRGSIQTISANLPQKLSENYMNIDIHAVERSIIDWRNEQQQYWGARIDNTLTMQPMVERIDRLLLEVMTRLDTISERMERLDPRPTDTIPEEDEKIE